MSELTNRERLEEAGILKKGKEYSEEQREALESLTEEEVEAVVTKKETLVNIVKKHPHLTAFINVHHIQ